MPYQHKSSDADSGRHFLGLTWTTGSYAWLRMMLPLGRNPSRPSELVWPGQPYANQTQLAFLTTYRRTILCMAIAQFTQRGLTLLSYCPHLELDAHGLEDPFPGLPASTPPSMFGYLFLRQNEHILRQAGMNCFRIVRSSFGTIRS